MFSILGICIEEVPGRAEWALHFPMSSLTHIQTTEQQVRVPRGPGRFSVPASELILESSHYITIPYDGISVRI